jgi:hypothetical protein
VSTDEIELLSRLAVVDPLPEEVAEQARRELRAAIAACAAPPGAPSATGPRARRARTASVPERRRRWVRAALVASAAAAVAVGGVTVFAAGPPGRPRELALRASGPRHASAPQSGRLLVYRLATAAASTPALQSPYVVLSETDTQSGYPGELKRTTIVNTQTGASTTYQQAYTTAGVKVPNSTYVPPPSPAVANPTPAQQKLEALQHAQENSGPPTVLTGAANPQLAEAWYAALPTDPTALRAKLLALATQPNNGIQPALTPGYTNDDYIYQEADTMLWSPLVSPALRSALYRVLAKTSGYTVAQGTDPIGRPAIVMTRTYTGSSETDITYENPTTGAVLAQVWKQGGGTITGIYQPVTGASTIPPNPYGG